MSFDIATLSRPGGRAVNEDYVDFLQMDGATCWVIADGLGGHQGGDIASKTVVQAALHSFRNRPDVSVDAVTSHIAHAQAALLDAQRHEPRLSQMRSTLVVLVCGERDAVWAHVGDSRLYHLRGGCVIDRTRDHSLGQALVDGGQIDLAAQGSHEDRSRLLRCLGKEEEAAATFSGPHALARGDVFLLCTDGFWEAVDDLALGIDLAASEDAATWLERLEARLRRVMRPSHDNYSATAVRVLNDALSAPPPHDPRAPRASSYSHHDDRNEDRIEHHADHHPDHEYERRVPRLGMQGVAVIGVIAIVLIAAGVWYRAGITAWVRALVTPAATVSPDTEPLPSVPKPPGAEPKSADPKRADPKEPDPEDAQPKIADPNAAPKGANSNAPNSKDASSEDGEIRKPASAPTPSAPPDESR